jgi:hypothetical protein
MRTANSPTDLNDDDRWRFDLTTVMVLVVILAIVLLMSFELWHSHSGIH